ncbi:MAG: nitroreductase family protein [Acidimicrobiales bacterium]
MDLREALYTTRAMRRITDQAIPQELQARILDAAVRAPSAGNTQSWRFLLVDDPDVRKRLGTIYKEAMDQFGRAHYGAQTAAAEATPEDPESRIHLRVMHSADYMADNFERYPLLLFGFGSDDVYSVCPALWTAMLAARGEGIGSCFTRMLAGRAADTFEVLGVPADEGWQMAGCVTFGYPTGRWGVAKRLPVEDVAFRNRWSEPLGFEVGGPLYP